MLSFIFKSIELNLTLFFVQCYTMPQYLKMRYGGQRIRIWLAILHIFLTIVAQIAVSIRKKNLHSGYLKRPSNI